MTTYAGIGMEEWVERARSLAPIVERYRDEGEAERHLPKPVVQEMRDRGLFSLWMPRNLGGAEVSIETSVRVSEELSRQDGSVGWNSMIAGNTSVLWAYIEHAAAARCINGDANTVLAGTVGGGGTAAEPGGGVATPVPGGYRLTGRWGFASGCHQADWLVANGRIEQEDGGFRLTPQGNVALFSFIVPAAELTIEDTWYTTGMRGTGSHHFSGRDLFVPEERVFSSINPAPHQPGPLFTTVRATPWAPNIAGVSLGIGRDAIDSFVAIARAKPAARNRSSLMERETIWRAVGEAEARLRSARAYLLETARAIDACIDRGADVPEHLIAQVRGAASHATASAAAAVDSMYTNAGSSSIYATSRLDRCFRDVHMVTQHGVGGLAGLTLSGRYLLGLGLPAM